MNVSSDQKSLLTVQLLIHTCPTSMYAKALYQRVVKTFHAGYLDHNEPRNNNKNQKDSLIVCSNLV